MRPIDIYTRWLNLGLYLLHVGMVTHAVIAILVLGVELLPTLVTRIFKQSRKVFAFHMPFLIDLL